MTVGVTPPTFFGIDVGQTFDVVLPLGTEPLISGPRSLLDTPQALLLQVIVRLGRTQSVDAATARLRELQPGILGLSPEQLSRMPPWLREPITLAPAATGLADVLRREYARSLLTLLAGVGLVLLMACVNLTNLMPARVRARETEIASGISLGLISAALVTRYVGSLLFEISALDPLSFVLAPCLLVLAAMLAALVPARRAARMDPVSALRCE